MKIMTPCLLFILFCFQSPVFSETNNRKIFINDNQLSKKQINQLEDKYHVRVIDGRYWYDKISGLWGASGNAPAGRMYPRHDFGKINRNASGGQSSIIFNGRIIHPSEVVFLRNCFGFVIPGNYWLNARGAGGPVGRPQTFDASICFKQASGGSRKESLLSGYFLTGVTVFGN